jgi:hypothetical protein
MAYDDSKECASRPSVQLEATRPCSTRPSQARTPPPVICLTNEGVEVLSGNLLQGHTRLA